MNRVLVIEDNKNNMYLVTFMLEKEGHEVLQAWTGEDGVEMALKERPDLIITDIKMPGIDGFEATRQIRKAEQEENKMPIVALTSYAMKGDRQKAFDAGCNAYIEKPIKPETFISQVCRYIGEVCK